MEKLPCKTITIMDPDTNMNIVLTKNNTYKYFDCVYIICPLNTITNQMVLYKCDIKLVSSALHFDNIKIGESDEYRDINLFGYDLKNYILTLKITNITFLNIQKYLDYISGLNTFDRFYDLVIMNEYFKTPINYNYLIKNLECALYWNDKKNCLINMNDEFSKRRFNVIKIKNCNDMKKALECDYLNSTNTIPEYNIDIYRKTKCAYTKNDITTFLTSIGEENRNHLFMQLILSKEHCHLVINNIDIMTLMQPYIKKNIVSFKNRLSYAWITFYLEELLDKNKINTNNDYIFDINTASVLPFFYNDITEPYSSPYNTTLLSYKKLSYGKNICGVDSSTRIDYKRICNLDEFKQRMNIFITGDMKIDIFSDIDFKKLNMGITGSIMTACAQYFHPLLQLFKNENPNITFNKFFDEYYNNSDIDIIINKPNIFEYFDTFTEFYTMLMINIIKYYNVEPDTINYEVIQNIYVFLDKDDEPEKTASNLFTEYTQELLRDFSKDEQEIIRKKYPDIFKFNYSNVIIKPKANQQEHLKKILVNYKFKIKCKLLNHNIEIFQCRANDIMNLVGNFHLPCVRAYYDGNVYMTPTFITAHMTYMNIDYRYFTGTFHPCDIIKKYRMRGFGTWLNKNELKEYIEKYNEPLGWLNINDLIFYPRKAEYDESYNDRYNINANIKKYTENEYNMDIFEVPIKMSPVGAIDKKTGKIIPYKNSFGDKTPLTQIKLDNGLEFEIFE